MTYTDWPSPDRITRVTRAHCPDCMGTGLVVAGSFDAIGYRATVRTCDCVHWLVAPLPPSAPPPPDWHPSHREIL